MCMLVYYLLLFMHAYVIGWSSQIEYKTVNGGKKAVVQKAGTQVI